MTVDYYRSTITDSEYSTSAQAPSDRLTRGIRRQESGYTTLDAWRSIINYRTMYEDLDIPTALEFEEKAGLIRLVVRSVQI
jgi:hypothetical protein